MSCKRIYNETVVADQKELELAQAQYETGIADQISVVEAQTTLQSAEAGATNIAVARAQYRARNRNLGRPKPPQTFRFP